MAMVTDNCPNCVTGELTRIPDSTTFYPQGFCYQCRSCRLKIHPDNTNCTPEQFCEMFDHKTSLLNKFNPLADTTCIRCDTVV